MCGRYKLTVLFSEIVRLYNLTRWPEDDDRHRYNIAPTDKVAVITSADGERVLELIQCARREQGSRLSPQQRGAAMAVRGRDI